MCPPFADSFTAGRSYPVQEVEAMGKVRCIRSRAERPLPNNFLNFPFLFPLFNTNDIGEFVSLLWLAKYQQRPHVLLKCAFFFSWGGIPTTMHLLNKLNKVIIRYKLRYQCWVLFSLSIFSNWVGTSTEYRETNLFPTLSLQTKIQNILCVLPVFFQRILRGLREIFCKKL